MWGGVAAGRAEPVRAAGGGVRPHFPLVRGSSASWWAASLPPSPPAKEKGCPLFLGLIWGHLHPSSCSGHFSLPPDPLSIPQGPLSKSGVPSSFWVLFSTLPTGCPLGPESPHPSLSFLLQSSLMDLADVFTAPAAAPATDPWGAPVSMAAALPTAAPASDPWGGPPVPQAADPWGGPAPTPASGDPWRPAAPAGPPADPWGGTQAPAAGEGPAPDPWGGSDGETPCPQYAALGVGDW